MPPTKWICERSAELPTASVAREVVKTRIQDVGYYLPRAAFLWEEDSEHVHGLRVATRRAAAALELFRSLLPPKRTRRLQKTLKRLRKCADSARDLDVFLARLERLTDAEASHLRVWLQAERTKAQSSIYKVSVPLLTQNSLATGAERVMQRISSPGDSSCRYGEWSARQLKTLWELFISQVPPPDPDPEQLHEFRIRGKRLRYSIEILSGGLPKLLREELYPEVTKLQEKLGAIQDHAVTAERLLRWQAEACNPTLKRFLAQLESNERKQCGAQTEAFQSWWDPSHVVVMGRLVDTVVGGTSPQATPA